MWTLQTWLFEVSHRTNYCFGSVVLRKSGGRRESNDARRDGSFQRRQAFVRTPSKESFVLVQMSRRNVRRCQPAGAPRKMRELQGVQWPNFNRDSALLSWTSNVVYRFRCLCASTVALVEALVERERERTRLQNTD